MTYQREKIGIKTESDPYYGYVLKHDFTSFPIVLCDLDKKIPYGMGGGTDDSNTHYKFLRLGSYAGGIRKISTENCYYDMKFYFQKIQWRMDGPRELAPIDDDVLVIDLEKSFTTYMSNILPYLGTEIRYAKRTNTFWGSDSGIAFKLIPADTDGIGSYGYSVIKANVFKGDRFLIDFEKSPAKLPAKYEIVDPAFITALVRKQFNNVRAVFLNHIDRW